MQDNSQERIEEPVLGSILDNTTSMLTYKNSEYILLIKKQRLK